MIRHAIRPVVRIRRLSPTPIIVRLARLPWRALTTNSKSTPVDATRGSPSSNVTCVSDVWKLGKWTIRFIPMTTTTKDDGHTTDNATSPGFFREVLQQIVACAVLVCHILYVTFFIAVAIAAVRFWLKLISGN